MKMEDIRTDYDAFVYASNMLLAQGDKSVDDALTCMYRGWEEQSIDKISHLSTVDGEIDNDLFLNMLAEENRDARCAVGYLISDTAYSEELENRAIDDSDVWDAVAKSNPNWIMDDDSSMDMMKHLQHIHDGMLVSQWDKSFQMMSRFFDDNGKYTKVFKEDE